MQFSKELWRFILSSYQLEKKVGINWNAIICKYLCTFLQIKCHILSNVICKCFEQYIIPACAKHCGSLLISFVKFKTYFCHHWMIELDDDLRLFLTSVSTILCLCPPWAPAFQPRQAKFVDNFCVSWILAQFLALLFLLSVSISSEVSKFCHIYNTVL